MNWDDPGIPKKTQPQKEKPKVPKKPADWLHDPGKDEGSVKNDRDPKESKESEKPADPEIPEEHSLWGK